MFLPSSASSSLEKGGRVSSKVATKSSCRGKGPLKTFEPIFLEQKRYVCNQKKCKFLQKI